MADPLEKPLFPPCFPPGQRYLLGLDHPWVSGCGAGLPAMGGCVISQIYMSNTSFVQTPQGMAMNAHRTQI